MRDRSGAVGRRGLRLGSRRTAAHQGPRAWQDDILPEKSGITLSNPATRFEPCRLRFRPGMASGKRLIGMLANWGLSTAEYCKVVCTANTDTQLRTKTSPEVGKWARMSITADWWDVQATSIAARDRGTAKDWRMDFVPWSETNTEAFASLHNQGRRIILIFDEGR